MKLLNRRTQKDEIRDIEIENKSSNEEALF